MLIVKLQEAEYVAANALHLKSSRRRAIVFWLAMLGLALAALWLWFFGRRIISGSNLAGLLGGCIGGVLGGVLATLGVRFLYVPWKARRVFRQQRSLQLPFELSWSEEGFVSRNEQGSYKTLWSDLVRWKENEQLFLLYISDAMFHILPKRAFPDAEAVSSFRELLRARIVT